MMYSAIHITDLGKMEINISNVNLLLLCNINMFSIQYIMIIDSNIVQDNFVISGSKTNEIKQPINPHSPK